MAGTYQLVNALDRFTSYSTHFIMVASRTTENAKIFGDESRSKETLDAINRTPALGDAVPSISGSTASDVYLVIDTRRFSQYTVQRMKFETFINGLVAGQAPANVPTIIELTVLDSVGISFINFMQWLLDSKMQTNFDGFIFMLRVLFVGHNPDGTSETVQSITIPCHLFKMEVNLDYAKGIYNLELMPNMNFSIFQHNRWLNIGRATTYFTGKGKNTLGDMVQDFEDALNARSTQYYNDVNASAPQILQAKGISTPSGKFGRQVKYMVTLPKDWGKLTFTGNATHSATERNFKAEIKGLDAGKNPEQKKAEQKKDEQKQEVLPAKDTNMSVEAGTTITEVLDLMFKQVPGIQEFAAGDKITQQDGKLTFYKHVVSLSSNDQEVTVHVDVVAFDVPNIKPPKDTGSNQVSTNMEYLGEPVMQNGVTRRFPKNYFELDYIYTGKNSDILNFDLKIQDLQNLIAANTKVSEGHIIAEALKGQTDVGQGTDAAQDQLQKEILNARPYDVLLLPKLTQLDAKAFSQLATIRSREHVDKITTIQQQYAQNTSAFYAISPIQVIMTIKGNPEIMAKFSIPKPPTHVSTTTTTTRGVSTTNLSEKDKYRAQFEQEILKKGDITEGSSAGTFAVKRQLGSDSYLSTPVFCTVNIMGPNVDFLTNAAIAGQDFATKVLFDNFYVVFKLTNIIENGVFTQELELHSFNVFGGNAPVKQEVDIRKKLA